MDVSPATYALKFVVVGGGLAGLASAVALQRAGHVVCVLEASEERPSTTAVMLCSPHTVRILKRLGADAITKRTPLLGTHFVDGTNNEFLQHLPFHETMIEDLGGGVFLCEYQRIYDWLLELAGTLGAEIRFGARVTEVDPTGPAVRLEDGEVVMGDIVVGADGWNSVVRDEVVGEPLQFKTHPQVTYSFVIPEERVADDPELLELTKALKENRDIYFMGDGSLIIALYIPQPSEYVLYLTAPLRNPVNEERRWDVPFSLDELDLDVDLESFSAPIQRLVRLADKTTPMPWLSHAALETWMHEDGRVIILGNAAEPAPPHTHEGSSAALGDGLTLGTLFSYLSAPTQIPMLLDAFEDLRRPRALMLAQEAAGVIGYFALPRGEMWEERNAGMKAAQDMFHGVWKGIDDETLGVVWTDFIRIAQYDAYEKACDWWTKWGGVFRRADGPKEGFRIPWEQHVEVEVEVV